MELSSIEEVSEGSSVLKFRKTSEVEAIIYSGNFDSAERVAEFCGGSVSEYKDNRVLINTNHGQIRVCPSDYVVRGESGFCYPWKKHIFEDCYVQDNNQ